MVAVVRKPVAGKAVASAGDGVDVAGVGIVGVLVVVDDIVPAALALDEPDCRAIAADVPIRLHGHRWVPGNEPDALLAVRLGYLPGEPASLVGGFECLVRRRRVLLVHLLMVAAQIIGQLGRVPLALLERKADSKILLHGLEILLSFSGIG